LITLSQVPLSGEAIPQIDAISARRLIEVSKPSAFFDAGD
jgi:hypothetical protein